MAAMKAAMMRTTLFRAAAAAALCLLFLAEMNAASFPITPLRDFSATLPAGEGKILVFKYCVACHGPELTRKRLEERRGWIRRYWEDLVFEMMYGWGATIRREEVEPIARYLEENFGPQPDGPEPPGKEALEAVLPPGEQSNVILAKCTVCHGPEVTMRRMQSRIGLSASGWKKLLTRMKSYGAPLAEDEMEQLSVYLSADFGSSYAPGEALPIREFYSFLPEGPGKDLVVADCLSCHAASELQKRMEDRPRGDSYYWEGVVRRMKKQWEAPLEEEEVDLAIEYLNAHFAG